MLSIDRALKRNLYFFFERKNQIDKYSQVISTFEKTLKSKSWLTSDTYLKPSQTSMMELGFIQ